MLLPLPRIKIFTGSCMVIMILTATRLHAQIVGPYIQSPTDTSVWITWKTGSDTESTVMYGSDSSGMEEFVSGNCQVMTDEGYSSDYYYHSVHISNLQPGRYYYYRVKSGTAQSVIFRFRSQPALSSPEGTYRILVFGDHQLRDDDRYKRLLLAARDKVIEKYGGPVEENIDLILNDGDQVDAGTLDQYENVHLKPSSIFSGNIAVMTTLGNHETYGSLGITAYYDHFFYDELGYKGIVSPGGENYYSYQENNIVFIHLSSEHTTDEQVEWVQQIIDSVKADPVVDWVVCIGHRPIQAEQFVGDMSEYIRTRIIPVLAQTEKAALFIAGHHHLYARGQVRDYPIYHIISGGAAWDQYWGQSVEKDFDDVQKTIDSWNYQIITFYTVEKEMAVESYSIGNPELGFAFNNVLIDSFYRKLPDVNPSRPSIMTVPEDSVSLPFIFVSSPYSSPAQIPYNSVQFQISNNGDRSTPVVDLIRDFEDIYGTTGEPDYSPVDLNKDLDIFKYTIGKYALPNGTYYISVRHRDKNITWSEWSDPVEFRVKGSTGGFITMTTEKTVFKKDENIPVSYYFGPGNALDWIGIYKTGDTPGPVHSIDWKYVNGSTGTVSLHVSQPGKYFIAFFENDGYYELTGRIPVYVISEPVLSLDKAGYNEGEAIEVTYSDAPGLTNDWIGIYRIDDVPGVVGSTLWSYTSGHSGKISFPGLPHGYYFVCYFLEDGYTEAGESVIFSSGSGLASLQTDKSVYEPGEQVTVTFENASGAAKDWIGIFRQSAPPGIAPLVMSQYTGPVSTGTISFETPSEPGRYFACLCINNSNIRISNKANFIVESGAFVPEQESASADLMVYPSPSSGRFRISAPMLRDKDVLVKISSINGTTVFEKKFRLTLSGTSEEIDLSRIGPGFYLVRLEAGDEILLSKLVLR